MALFLCLGVSSLHAAVAFSPDQVGSSADSIARGNVAGFGHTASSIFDNPAALNRVDSMSFSMFSTTFMEQINYLNVAYAAKTKFGTFAVGTYMASVSDLISTIQDGTSGENVAQGTFNYKNQLTKFAYAFSPFENVYLGTAFLAYFNGFDTGNYQGRGYNVETGAILDLSPLQVSFVATNLFPSQLSFDSGGSDYLAQRLTLGGQFDAGLAQLQAQVQQTDGRTGLLESMSISAPLVPGLLRAAAGYKQYYSDLNTIQSTYAVGMGLSLNGLDFDYAYERSENPFYNGKHYFSFSAAFGDKLPESPKPRKAAEAPAKSVDLPLKGWVSVEFNLPAKLKSKLKNEVKTTAKTEAKTEVKSKSESKIKTGE